MFCFHLTDYLCAFLLFFGLIIYLNVLFSGGSVKRFLLKSAIQITLSVIAMMIICAMFALFSLAVRSSDVSLYPINLVLTILHTFFSPFFGFLRVIKTQDSNLRVLFV